MNNSWEFKTTLRNHKTADHFEVDHMADVLNPSSKNGFGFSAFDNYNHIFIE